VLTARRCLPSVRAQAAFRVRSRRLAPAISTA